MGFGETKKLGEKSGEKERFEEKEISRDEGSVWGNDTASGDNHSCSLLYIYYVALLSLLSTSYNTIHGTVLEEETILPIL